MATTFQPSLANRTTAALPKPLLVPVITMVLVTMLFPLVPDSFLGGADGAAIGGEVSPRLPGFQAMSSGITAPPA